MVAIITCAANPAITVITGPQTARSRFEGVIQFNTQEITLTPKATQPVHRARPNPGNPAADKIASP